MLKSTPNPYFSSRIGVVACCALFLFGCATQPEPIKPPDEPVKPVKRKPAPPVTKAPVRAAKSADGLIDGEIVGTPVPGSKFAQLQIGMTLEQVKELIGPPNATDSRVTGKVFQPFYAGGDTQRTEAYYKNEGQLTFSNMREDSPADTLIRILVNPNATGAIDKPARKQSEKKMIPP